MNKKFFASTMVVFASLATWAHGGFLITEVYTGVSGADGTPDWFELTNFGNMPASTLGLFYDDDSRDPTNNYALPDFTVAPGESVIVLIETGASSIPLFYSFWGLTSGDVHVGFTGGGSLSQSGDAVYVFDGNTPGANVVDSLIYPSSLAGRTGTIEDITGHGPLTNSQVGVNGAFQSVGTTGIGRIVGSPGLIPEVSEGGIVAWGNNDSGQCRVPAPNSDFVGVAAGNEHSLGLKLDRSIVAWGMNMFGQCNVPEPNADFAAVAAGIYHSLALRADGSTVAWGCGDAEYDYGQCNVPAPNADFVAVAACGAHSLALKGDGSIVAWGCGDPNNYGQCNVPAPNADFVGIAAGRWHSLGLKRDGSIVAWEGSSSVPAPNTDFVAIAEGGFHSLALKGIYGDFDVDGFVDLDDFGAFAHCLSGPGLRAPLGCARASLDGDVDVDLADFAIFQRQFTSAH